MNKLTQKSKKAQNHLGSFDPKVAGIDIGKDLIHVSFYDGKGGSIVQEFGSTTPQLLEIAKTLKKAKVRTAVMESTGVYWIPLFEVLEDQGLEAILVDARSVKNVPGRKTDVQDCQWIQTLYSNGLLRPAFRPEKPRIRLREFVRHRSNIVKARRTSLLHMEKALQLMNIKLGSALSDISTISGLDIVRAIARGIYDARELAKLRNRTCKKSEEVFVASLSGNFQEEHLFSLKQALAQYDFFGTQLEQCDERIQKELESLPDQTDQARPQHAKDRARKQFSQCKKARRNGFSIDIKGILWKKSGFDLTALRGIDDFTALTIFSELGGTDTSPWKTSKHFCSWLKLCPGNNISGGKRKSGKGQKCVNRVTQALRMAAQSAKRSNTALGAYIRRMCARLGNKEGIKAGAHKLARWIYFMIKHGWDYVEGTVEQFEQDHQARKLRNLQRAASEMGYELTTKAA